VYVHDDYVLMSSSVPYGTGGLDDIDRCSNITNRCVQMQSNVDEYTEDKYLYMLPAFIKMVAEDTGLDCQEVQQRVQIMQNDVRKIVSGVFEGFQRVPPVAWCPFEQCFEIFGLDVLLDEDWNCWLLEVNCGPDLSVFGAPHTAAAEAFFDDTVKVALEPFINETPHVPATKQRVGGYELVYEQDCSHAEGGSMGMFKRVMATLSHGFQSKKGS